MVCFGTAIRKETAISVTNWLLSCQERAEKEETPESLSPRKGLIFRGS
jgi:hypothetical protein